MGCSAMRAGFRFYQYMGDTQATFDEILEMLSTLEFLHQEDVSVSVTTNDPRARMMDLELVRLNTLEVKPPPLSRPGAGPDLVHLHLSSLYLEDAPPGLHFYLPDLGTLCISSPTDTSR